MKHFVLALVTFFALTLATNIARADADVFTFEDTVIGGASIDGDRLQAVMNARADVLLGDSAIVMASARRVGERTTVVEVIVHADHISPDDAQRLRQAIGESMRLRRVVETVRFGGPKR